LALLRSLGPDQTGAQCDLAMIGLHGDDLDGTADALRPVLDLPPSRRNRGIAVSAPRVRAALTREPVRSALLARDLREETALFLPDEPALPR
jgi:hypothetical protein